MYPEIEFRPAVTILLTISLMAAFFPCGIAMSDSGAPVVYNYQDPSTGTIVSYVGIPGGPVVYSKLGPDGINSVSSIDSGNPIVYSSLGPGGITSVSYVSPGEPIVVSRLGENGIISVTYVNQALRSG